MRLSFLPVLLLAGCTARPTSPPVAPPLPTSPTLNATLWAQSAVEAKVSAAQSFQLATLQLDAVLQDKAHSAALEQTGNFAALPPAVILDIDETVLDNSPFQARLLPTGRDWDVQLWEQWVSEARAKAVPGALAFVNAARRKGVRVFFVTNRGRSDETHTAVNLRKLGFPVESRFDNLLHSGEKPEWSSDKTTRRAFVARTHRIIMLVGDDFNDFVSGTQTTPQARHELSQRHRALWGKRWIMLPNPQYGSWEKASYAFRKDLSIAQRNQLKQEALTAL